MALQARTKVAKPVPTITHDFGSLKDWNFRLGGSLVWYDDKPFYVKKIVQEDSPEVKKLVKKFHDLQHRVLTATSNAELDAAKPLAKEAEKAYKAARKKQTTQKTAQGSGYSISLKGVVTAKSLTVPVEDLDLSFKKLGFINLDGKAVYLSRTANRQNRHGLDSNNTRGYDIISQRLSPIGVSKKSVVKTLMEGYPSLSDCLDTLFPLEGSNAMAFDEDFAVKVDDVGNVTLYCRRDMVGSSQDEGATFNLLGRHEYLREMLEKIGVSVAS